jgi:hypothetical protein
MHQVFQQMRTEFTKSCYSIALAVLFLCAMGLDACSVLNPGLVNTPTPMPTSTPTPTETPTPLPDGYVEYFSQSGDTLDIIASHFGVSVSDIMDDSQHDASLLLDPGTRLLVKDVVDETTKPDILFPDSAIVFSPTAALSIHRLSWISNRHDQDIYGNDDARCHFSGEYHLRIGSGLLHQSDDPAVVMEYEGNWLSSPKPTGDQFSYPMGWIKKDRSGVYFQTGWAVKQLTRGYYLWRIGTLTDLTFADGTTLRLSPQLNAGTVAVMYTLAQIDDRAEWEEALYGEHTIRDVYTQYFGDPFMLGKGSTRSCRQDSNNLN